MDNRDQTEVGGRRLWLILAALCGASAVVMGALGAHGSVAEYLRSRGPESEAVWRTASLYHLVHAAVLLAWSLRPATVRSNVPAWLILCGTLCFSGSLYVLACYELKFIGPVTPIGGLLLILGWLAIVISAARCRA